MVKHGVVETADKVRTAARPASGSSSCSRERPIERLAILHTVSPDVEAFRDELLARVPGRSTRPSHDRPGRPSVGPHLGPGCVGAVVLYRS